MFGKILIANRGEIACRIIRTCRAMGIGTVAIYSEADRDSLHVEMADEAIAIGPAPASQSYLVIDRIVAACRATGAEAVHPGYGFLSERAAFPRALAAAGIVFVGPNADAIDAMGDKIQSKRFAAAAGVSTVPGSAGVVESADEAIRIADEIGYPVMIKASAGGGGKGMRIAHARGEVQDGFDRARSEAASSFGDDRVFVEKFIIDPRHVEIQVMGDKHGHVVHLGERECSIQRRNQKVIEEAPSPLLDVATRAAMGGQAVALAQAVGYDSAGTVEFVASQDRSFYFLEMNTRLQVEHPVTELVTGIDIVEAMIRIAAGEPLPWRQDDIAINGSAIEARLYAEDPFRNFLPSTGRLVRYRTPDQGRSRGRTIRIDTGVVEGSEISLFYDPMIAKVVAHAGTRTHAIDAMSEVLDRIEIEGIRPNLPFLAALMQHPRWREGQLSTRFIAEEFPEGFRGRPLDQEARRVIACAALARHLAERSRLERLPGRLRARPRSNPASFVAMLDGDPVGIRLLERHTDWPLDITVQLDGEDAPVRITSGAGAGSRLWEGTVGALSVAVRMSGEAGRLLVEWRGADAAVRIMSPAEAELFALMPKLALAGSGKSILCPMPGLVVSIAVSEGQQVEAGDPVAVVEAMKMENVLTAEHAGVVKAVHARPGDSLPVDAVIVELE